MIPKELTHARFRRGYTHTAMLFRIDNIAIGRGKPEWGAPITMFSLSDWEKGFRHGKSDKQ